MAEEAQHRAPRPGKSCGCRICGAAEPWLESHPGISSPMAMASTGLIKPCTARSPQLLKGAPHPGHIQNLFSNSSCTIPLCCAQVIAKGLNSICLHRAGPSQEIPLQNFQNLRHLLRVNPTTSTLSMAGSGSRRLPP